MENVQDNEMAKLYLKTEEDNLREEAEDFIRTMKIKKSLFGYDKEDTLLKIKELNQIYEKILEKADTQLDYPKQKILEEKQEPSFEETVVNSVGEIARMQAKIEDMVEHASALEFKSLNIQVVTTQEGNRKITIEAKKERGESIHIEEIKEAKERGRECLKQRTKLIV